MVLCAVLLASADLGAQVLLGTLFDDDTGLGIDGASITLFSIQGQRFGSVMTGTEGRFVMNVGRLGDFKLEAQRLGYRTTRSQQFTVSSIDTLTVSFYVSTDAILLDPPRGDRQRHPRT